MQKIIFTILSSVILTLFFSYRLSSQIEIINPVVDGVFSERDEDVSPYEHYKNVVAFNRYNENIKSRNKYVNKVDSAYSIISSLGSSFIRTKTEYIFDNDNLKENQLGFVFNDELQVFEPRSNGVLSYNKRDLLIRQTFNFWDGNYDDLNEDITTVKRQYYYNEDDQLIKYEEQDGYDISLNIIPFFRTYEYDSLGLLSRINDYRWLEEINDHYINGIDDFYYNDDQQLELIIGLGIYPDGRTLLGDSLIFHYNDSGLLDLQTNYNYALSGDLELFDEFTYVYDEDGKLIEEILYENYNEISQDWYKRSRINYEYDSTDKLKFSRHYTRLNDDDWDYWQETKYTHDENMFPESTQIPRKNVSNFSSNIVDNSQINILTQYKESTVESNFSLSLRTQFQYFFSPIITNTTEELENQYSVVISPNPTIDYIKIEIEDYNGLLDVSILDVQGKVLLEDKIRSTEQVNVSDLESGVYFYRIQIEDNIVGGKFVKVD